MPCVAVIPAMLLFFYCVCMLITFCNQTMRDVNCWQVHLKRAYSAQTGLLRQSKLYPENVAAIPISRLVLKDDEKHKFEVNMIFEAFYYMN